MSAFSNIEEGNADGLIRSVKPIKAESSLKRIAYPLTVRPFVVNARAMLLISLFCSILYVYICLIINNYIDIVYLYKNCLYLSQTNYHLSGVAVCTVHPDGILSAVLSYVAAEFLTNVPVSDTPFNQLLRYEPDVGSVVNIALT